MFEGQFVPRSKQFILFIETGHLMLFRELLFGLRCVQNTYLLLCGWRVELPNVKSGGTAMANYP
jgi:hypothetical protein